MRIVDRETFLKMPAGTVFSKYDPWLFYGMRIKGATVEGGDFLYQDLSGGVEHEGIGALLEKLFRAEKSGASLKMDFMSEDIDGIFDKEKMFAVLEEQDVIGLIKRLSLALESYKRVRV